MKSQFQKLLKYSISSASQLREYYRQYKVSSEQLKCIKYRIHSNIAFYQKHKMIQLSFADKPGDLLSPMSICQVKNTFDLIHGMHPIDVNSINDLFYLSQDKITQLVVTGEKIRATTALGEIVEYDINDSFDYANLPDKRISYLIGYMQAEKLLKKINVTQEKFKLLKDNISSLLVLDVKNKVECLRSPQEILFSNEYIHYSKEDIARIGFICGQMSQIKGC